MKATWRRIGYQDEFATAKSRRGTVVHAITGRGDSICGGPYLPAWWEENLADGPVTCKTCIAELRRWRERIDALLGDGEEAAK